MYSRKSTDLQAHTVTGIYTVCMQQQTPQETTNTTQMEQILCTP